MVELMLFKNFNLYCIVVTKFKTRNKNRKQFTSNEHYMEFGICDKNYYRHYSNDLINFSVK